MSRWASKWTTATGPCAAAWARSMGGRWCGPAQGEHERGALEQVSGPVLDGGDGLVDAEWVDGQVPGVGHLEVGERGRGQGRVVGPQQARGLADVRRAEPRAGPVADAAVERHAEHGGVPGGDVGGAGSRAKVASPAYRGITVASTWPTTSPTTTLGTGSVMKAADARAESSAACSQGCSTRGHVDHPQLALAGLDSGLLGGQVQRPGQQQVYQAGHDQADQPGVVDAVGDVAGEVARCR